MHESFEGVELTDAIRRADVHAMDDRPSVRSGASVHVQRDKREAWRP
jgi:hypothetical protein